MADYAAPVMPSASPLGATSALLLHRDPHGGALFPVLGMPIIAWQAELISHAGIKRTFLFGQRLPEPLATRLADGTRLDHVADVSHLPAALSGTVLLLAEGLLIDPRAVAAFLRLAPAPALLVFSGPAPPGAERLDRDTHWAGAALLPAAMVAETATELGDWDLASTLIRVADASGATRMAIESIDLDLPEDRERRTPPSLIWALPTETARPGAISHALLANSMPDGPDWTEQLLYRPMAMIIARSIADTALPPVIWRWLAMAMLLAAAILFAGHQFWPALAILLLAPLPDQIGRILLHARWQPAPRLLPATDGPFMLLAALAVAGLGLALAGQALPAAPIIASIGILLFSGLRVARLSWLRRMTGRHMDQFGSRDRRIAGLFGPITSLALPLLPFAVAGLWWEGLIAVLLWSSLLFLLLEWRFLAAIASLLDRDRGRVDRLPPVSRP